jgi:hypothetical protein
MGLHDLLQGYSYLLPYKNIIGSSPFIKPYGLTKRSSGSEQAVSEDEYPRSHFRNSKQKQERRAIRQVLLCDTEALAMLMVCHPSLADQTHSL